jgi:hypothetical protein
MAHLIIFAHLYRSISSIFILKPAAAWYFTIKCFRFLRALGGKKEKRGGKLTVWRRLNTPTA